MVDTKDSKSFARKGVRVRIPLRVLTIWFGANDLEAICNRAWRTARDMLISQPII